MLEGFSQLFIQNVPMGCILNKDSNYILEPTDSYINREKGLMLEMQLDGTYKLYPTTEEASNRYMGKMPVQQGDLEFLKTIIEQL
jgi:hypothetical protein